MKINVLLNNILLIIFESLLMNVKISIINALDPCKSNYYQCGSGDCIDRRIICDGKPDCHDGSDEIAQLCSTNECYHFEFRCNYGACTPLTKICNDVFDCVDGSDEPPLNNCTLPEYSFTAFYSDAFIGSTVPKTSNNFATRAKNEKTWKNDRRNLTLTKAMCKLPPQLQEQVYTISGCEKNSIKSVCQSKPEDYVDENTILHVRCIDNFWILGAKKQFSVICLDREWNPEISRCVKLIGKSCQLPTQTKDHGYSIENCDQDPSDSICVTQPGENVEQFTEISFRCNKNFYNPEGQNVLVAACLNGQWSTSIQCVYDDRKKPCTLPDKSQNYTYDVENCEEDPNNAICYLEPGSEVKMHTTIHLKCNANFYSPKGEDAFFALCLDGQWDTSIQCGRRDDMPCILPVESKNYTYRIEGIDICKQDPDNAICSLKPGDKVESLTTVINFKCQQHFYNMEGPNKFLSYCVEGNWEPTITKCVSSSQRIVRKQRART